MPSLAVLRQFAEQSPDNINLWLDLCAAAEQERNYTEVLHAGDQIVRLAPNHPQSHYIRGMALHRLQYIEEAISAYERVVALDPNYADGWINLGDCHQMLNHIAESEHAARCAIASSGQAIADEETRQPDESEYGERHWNLALLELLKGDYKRGFARYPARFKAIAGRKRPNFPQPLWRGENLNGKTIFVTVDQGHGDTLMMARYLPLLRERGAYVILQVQKPLLQYLKGWKGIDEIIEQGATPPPFDYHASEFDLPHYFGTMLKTVPVKVPYLPLPPPDDATKLPDDGKPKVGVTWAGNPDHKNDKRRSIPLAVFASLFDIEDIHFYSLTRDRCAWDEQYLAHLPVTDLAPQLSDFNATARIINQLDLVITCDTSTAHLAGGMGKPVWILLPFAPAWCWMVDRADCVWYPTARLFRQKKPSDWPVALKSIHTELAEWKKSFAAGGN